MKYLPILIPLISALTTSAQTKTTVDSLRHTVTVAKRLHNGQVDVHLYYWEDWGLRERVEFLTRELVETRRRLDSLINEMKDVPHFQYQSPVFPPGWMQGVDSADIHRIIEAGTHQQYHLTTN